MVELVRGKLTKLQRLTIGALIVLDVNNLQSTENMEKKKIDSIHDFDWIKQMRFYRKKTHKNLYFFKYIISFTFDWIFIFYMNDTTPCVYSIYLTRWLFCLI